MKNYLFSSAALIAFGVASAAAVAAPPPVSGFVGVNLGASWTDFDVNEVNYGTNDTAFVFGGRGRVNAWLSQDMSIQLDAEGESTTSIDWRKGSYCPTCSADGRTGGIIGAHLSWRDPQSHLIGVFGGFSGQSNLEYDGTMTNGIIGVEGQFYSGPITLYGQAGFAPLMSESDENEPENLWFLRGVGRYFWSDNNKLEGEFSYGNSDINGEPGEFDIYNWGLSWQHRYRDTPFSTTIAYTGMYASSDGPSLDNWASENIVSVAFNIHFGGETLQQADREGETLDMPNFNRAEAWSWWLGR